MKIALIQFEVQRENRDANLRSIRRRLRDVEVDLVILPELASSGYLFANRRSLSRMAEQAAAGWPTYDALLHEARRMGASIVAGFPEMDGDRIYNSAMVVGPAGLVGVYRKAHLFDREHLLFDTGYTGFKVFAVKGARVGVMICFDWIFPESCRSLALGGAQVIAHPANLVLPYCQAASITRAIENRVFIATANRIGSERTGRIEIRFTGKSQVVSPGGEVLGRAPASRPATIVADIDPGLADDKKITSRDDLLKSRRPKLYRI